MHAAIEIGVRVLEAMFGAGIVVAMVSVVMGLIDDIRTFFEY